MQGAWMSNGQFLDGLALSGLLPAPLIIFSTFVGYLGGGPWGAVMMTVGIFLPAFAFTLVGHDALERVVHQPRIRLFRSEERRVGKEGVRTFRSRGSPDT